MNFVRSEHSETTQQLLPTPDGAPVRKLVFGCASAMRDVKRIIQSIANTDLPLLLQDGSGAGKNLCAQFIHQDSMRSPDALVKVNCPAVQSSPSNTELFGYDKGAFAGPEQARAGKVEQARHKLHSISTRVVSIANIDLPTQAQCPPKPSLIPLVHTNQGISSLHVQ